MSVGQVNYGLFASGVLGPGASAFWFSDNRDSAKVRWYIAVPYGSYPINGGGPFNPAYDQMAEVTQVYHLLKGGNHDVDQTGGTGTLQVNVIVRNLDTANPLFYELLEAETL